MSITSLARAARLPVLILDFDGPICAVYAGLPDVQVAQRLRGILTAHGDDLSAEVAGTRDPLEVLRFTAEARPDLVPEVDAELTRAELHAIDTATVTPGIREVLARADLSRTGIVSNNARLAIVRFLTSHGLPQPAWIIGRPSDPQRMKPHPGALVELARLAGRPAADCVLVGDSTSDIEAAQAAGMTSIGYANKPGKADQFARAGADAVIDHMTDLARALPGARV